MRNGIIIPDRQHFKDLVSYCLPSSFRHELINAVSMRTDDIATTRRECSTIDKLARMISLLGQGYLINFGDYPHGIYQQLLLLTLSGDSIGTDNNSSLDSSHHGLESNPRGCIAMAVRHSDNATLNISNLPSLSLVFFPAATHVPSYFAAGAYSMKLGPSDKFPGSVGFLRLNYDQEKRLATIETIQSSVRHRTPEVKAELEKNGCNLSRYYFNWKFELLDLAFSFTKSLGLDRVFFGPNPDDEFSLSYRIKGHELIKRKAKESGFKLSDDGNNLFLD